MEPFENELRWIKNDSIRDYAKRCLEIVPEYFYKVPASSTGKYHPEYTLGEGGLYRHVRAAVAIAHELFNITDGLSNDEKDAILVALMLHDAFKSGEVQEKYTRFDHPLIAQKKFDEIDHKGISEPVYGIIITGIASHMGQWNTNSYYPGVMLPTPHTDTQKFIHMCDYLASRKFIEVKLGE